MIQSFKLIKQDVGLKPSPVFDISPTKSTFFTLVTNEVRSGVFQNSEKSGFSYSLSKPYHPIITKYYNTIKTITGDADNHYISFINNNEILEIHQTVDNSKLFPIPEQSNVSKVKLLDKLYLLKDNQIIRYNPILQNSSKFIENADAFTPFYTTVQNKGDPKPSFKSIIIYLKNKTQIIKKTIENGLDPAEEVVIAELPQNEREVIDMFSLFGFSIAVMTKENSKILLRCLGVPKNSKTNTDSKESGQEEKQDKEDSKGLAQITTIEISNELDTDICFFSMTSLNMFFVGSSKSPDIIAYTFQSKLNQIQETGKITINMDEGYEDQGVRMISLVESQFLIVQSIHGIVSLWDISEIVSKSEKSHVLVSKLITYNIPESVYEKYQQKEEITLPEIPEKISSSSESEENSEETNEVEEKTPQTNEIEEKTEKENKQEEKTENKVTEIENQKETTKPLESSLSTEVFSDKPIKVIQRKRSYFEIDQMKRSEFKEKYYPNEK